MRDVIALTKFFESNIEVAFQGSLDALDKELKHHLVFVFNQTPRAVIETPNSRHFCTVFSTSSRVRGITTPRGMI